MIMLRDYISYVTYVSNSYIIFLEYLYQRYINCLKGIGFKGKIKLQGIKKKGKTIKIIKIKIIRYNKKQRKITQNPSYKYHSYFPLYYVILA